MYLIVETLITDNEQNTVLGVLSLLRQLIPISLDIIWQLHFKNMLCKEEEEEEEIVVGCHGKNFIEMKDSTFHCRSEYRQILEIYAYCLHLISSTPLMNHGIINAALEVINTVLQSLTGCVQTSWDHKSNTRSHLHSILTRLMVGDGELKHSQILQNPLALGNQILNQQNDHSDELEEDDDDFEQVKDVHQWTNDDGDYSKSKYREKYREFPIKLKVFNESN